MRGRADRSTSRTSSGRASRSSGSCAQVGGAELEDRDAQPVRPRLRQVDDEALALQHGEQVVGGGPRQAELAGERGGRHRGRPGRQQPQHRRATGPAARTSGSRRMCLGIPDRIRPPVPADAATRRPMSMGAMTVETVPTVAVSGARRSTRPTSSPSRGTARAVELAARRWPRWPARRAVVDALAGDGEPLYGVSTGFGALATRYIDPPSCARSCSARWSARTRPGRAPRSSARWSGR